MGWTSALGAAAAKPRLDVVTKNAINAGDFPGPRYLAGSQEITVPGMMGDNTLPHVPNEALNFGAVCWGRSEEHTSELQSLMRSSYAVFCLKKNKTNKQ